MQELCNFRVHKTHMAQSRRRLSFSPAKENKSKPGNSCELCLAPRTCTQLAAWKTADAQQMAITQLNLTQQSYICRLCRDDITKMIKNPGYVPRWAREERKGHCCIPSCTNAAFVKSKIATIEETTQILNLDKGDDVPFPTPMCKRHYHKVYDTLQNKQTHCCTCGSSLRSAPFRICPNAMHIQKYLRENTGFEGNLNEGDRVCSVILYATSHICRY